MPKVIVPFLSAVCVAALQACVSVPSETESATRVNEQLLAIEAMTNQQLPPDKVAELYSEYFSDNAVVLPSGGSPIEGKENIRAFYESAFEGVTLIANDYSEPVITVDGLIAIRKYEGTGTIRLDTSGEEIATTNIYTDVLSFDGDEWKMGWHSWTPKPVE